MGTRQYNENYGKNHSSSKPPESYPRLERERVLLISDCDLLQPSSSMTLSGRRSLALLPHLAGINLLRSRILPLGLVILPKTWRI